MNKAAGRYWKPEPELLAYLQQEPLRLNPQPRQIHLERLHNLYTDTVGGIILVTKQFSKDGSASDPFITINAAPSLAPLGAFLMADPPGIAIDNYWDPAVLAPYDIQIGDRLHCPLLAAKEGFSRTIKLPGATDFLNDAQPLFFLLGEQMATTVKTTTGTVHRAFFLPKVCNIRGPLR
jgi:hypothetical protein